MFFSPQCFKKLPPPSCSNSGSCGTGLHKLYSQLHLIQSLGRMFPEKWKKDKFFLSFSPLHRQNTISSFTLDLEISELTLYHTIPTLNDLEEKKRPFINIVGKGENAGNQHFLLFPLSFLPFISKF